MNDTIVSRLNSNPKNIFLLDSLGAFTTAFFLLVILRSFNEYVGMPKITLTYLAVTALLFCIYSATCFSLLKNKWQPFLLQISIANLLYCLATIILMTLHYQDLTIIGIAYFVAEIIIVCGLVFLELKIWKASTNR